MAVVVVRVESQELLVDLVESAGKTFPSTLSPVAQTGRGGQVALPVLPSHALCPALWQCYLTITT